MCPQLRSPLSGAALVPVPLQQRSGAASHPPASAAHPPASAAHPPASAAHASACCARTVRGGIGGATSEGEATERGSCTWQGWTHRINVLGFVSTHPNLEFRKDVKASEARKQRGTLRAVCRTDLWHACRAFGTPSGRNVALQ